MRYESPFRNHSSQLIVAELTRYRTGERKSTVRVLMLLAEVDRRKLYAGLGYSSLYEYCLEELHYSEDEAYLRIGVSRAARRFPRMFGMIERGELHLSGASRVAPQLTPENANEILDAVVHKTKREIEEILVRWNPQEEDLPDSMMPVDVDHPSHIAPLSPGRFSICFTASARCCDLIGEAKALSSHRSPRAGLGEIIEAALEAYVKKLEKQKYKKTDRPQPQREEPSADPRHIPAQVMREVYERDAAAARTWDRTAAAAVREPFWSSTTSSRSPSVARAPPRTCAFAVSPTTSSPPANGSGRSTCHCTRPASILLHRADAGSFRNEIEKRSRSVIASSARRVSPASSRHSAVVAKPGKPPG